MTTNELKRRRILVILCVYFLFALHAVRRAMLGDLQPADMAVGVALQVFMTMFCIIDSKCRGEPLLHSFYWIIFFTWPVTVPIYWIWTRGLRGIISGMLFAVSLAIVSVVAFMAAWHLSGGQAWLE